MQAKVHLPIVTEVIDYSHRLEIYSGPVCLASANISHTADDKTVVTDVTLASRSRPIEVLEDGSIAVPADVGEEIMVRIDAYSAFGTMIPKYKTSKMVTDDDDVVCFETRSNAVCPICEDEPKQGVDAEPESIAETVIQGEQSEPAIKPEVSQEPADSLSKFKLTSHELHSFQKADPPILTLADAKAYWESHGNSFEPLEGFGNVSSKVVAVKLGLLAE